MANAPRDENRVTTILGVSSDNPDVTLPLQVNPVTGRVKVEVSGTSSGDVTGPASATDNALVRFDGTTGKTIQNSGVTINDSDEVSGATIDLTDNTLSGTKAEFDTACSDGDFVFDGDTIPVADGGTGATATTGTGNNVLSTSPTLVTPALGTPASGVMTNMTGLPVSGLADGTDGELITWDASGVATTVGAGTAAQILTSNGPGAAPTFQDASGGSGGMTLISTTTVATAVTNVDFSSSIMTGYDAYIVRGYIEMTSADRLIFKISNDNLSTFKNCYYVNNTVKGTGTASNTGSTSGTTDVQLTRSQNTSSGTLKGISLNMFLSNNTDSLKGECHTSHYNTSSEAETCNLSIIGSSAGYNSIRFTGQSSTIADGFISVYGITT